MLNGVITVFDLNFDSHPYLGHPSSTQALKRGKGWPMYTGQIVFSQLMRFLAKIRVQPVREPLPGQLPTPEILLPRSIPVHGLRATDLSREPSRYTNLFAGPSAQALSCRHPRQSLSRSTLADANESRDWRIYADFAQVLIRIARTLYAEEDFGLQLQQTVVCLRLQHDRSLSFALPLGSVSQTQGRDQTPHFDGLTRQHSLFYPHYRAAKHTTSTSSTN